MLIAKEKLDEKDDKEQWQTLGGVGREVKGYPGSS